MFGACDFKFGNDVVAPGDGLYSMRSKHEYKATEAASMHNSKSSAKPEQMKLAQLTLVSAIQTDAYIERRQLASL